jgi:uncharacterized membrane protein YfcA
MVVEILGLLFSGVIAGLTAGLLGLGGGIVIIPTLVWIFHAHLHISETHQMHLALGTSLATIIATASSSILAHHRRGTVLWPVVMQLVPGLITGALIGAGIASLLSSALLKNSFGLFLIFVALQLGLGIQPPSHRHLPNKWGLRFVGLGIGSVSTLMGIGGGSLTVPFLVWCNVSIRHAVAVAATCGLPIALFGAIGFIITGWQITELPAYSSGYVYWPAVLMITPVSMLLAPVGAKWA